MKKIFIFLMVTAAAVCLFGSAGLAASQTNLVVSPPPLPWHEFTKGQFDLKLGGQYVSVESTDPESSLAITGGGVNLSSRYAFLNPIALDFMFNYIYIGGLIGDDGSTVDVHFLSWNPNLEFQLVNTPDFSFIFFGGYIWTLVPMTYYPVDSYAISATANMDGIQFGAQLAIKAGDFAIAPFFLYQSLSGSVQVNGYWSDIPSQSVTTFGFDIAYVPWAMTLSGLMQQVNQNSKFKVYYIALSHDFQFGGASDEPEPAEKSASSK